MPPLPPVRGNDRGSALLALLAVVGLVIGVAVLGGIFLSGAGGRESKTADSLIQAKEALIGYAASYRGNHAGTPVFGYLPCPDTNNDGVAEPTCGTAGEAAIGRLPWKTLGLPPPRDGWGECFWYAVAGNFKNNPPTTPLNWDTLGQFQVLDGAGVTLAGTAAHDRPAAVIFSAGPPVSAQTRPTGANACSGDATNGYDKYLEQGTAFNNLAAAPITLTQGTTGSDGNNDHLQWLTPDEIFTRVKQRADFNGATGTGDVNTLMFTDLQACLNTKNPLPAATGSKGTDSLGVDAASCQPTLGVRRNFFDNWKNNLLYKVCSPVSNCLTVNGTACAAVVIFAGQRSATENTAGAQTRADSTQIATVSNYLGTANTANFALGSGAVFTGTTAYDKTQLGQDVLACITSVAGSNLDITGFGSGFATAGTAVSVSPSTLLLSGAGASGCLWSTTAAALDGKTLRTYFTFQFTSSDASGSANRRYGFTYSLLGDDGVGAPNTCGTAANMGAQTSWLTGLLVETDVYRQSGAGYADPAGNHVAIMVNNNLDHSLPSNGGTTTGGCEFAAVGGFDKFEESPPLPHNQRIEVQTRCNSTCTSCGAAGTYARMQAWVDCAGAGCSDTSADFASTPTVKKCVALDPAMNTFYFGFTGGWGSGANSQGVTIQNFRLQTQ
jgi:hypothetical protein